MILKIFLAVVPIYMLICLIVYLVQERLIFFPEKLDKNYAFSFTTPFEEINVPTGSGDVLNGLLFRSEHSRGLVFYLHGNAGSLRTWGDVAERYTALQYDVFIPDYPGYGKSTGTIRSRKQLYDGIQTAFDEMRKRYPDSGIVILGYSIGTGPAAHLASRNAAKLLILQAPYYSFADLARRLYPVVPSFLLKYQFNTAEYLKSCRMPVVIFHGRQDEVVYYGSSLKLKKEFKPDDTLITLNGQGHNSITDNPEYAEALQAILR